MRTILVIDPVRHLSKKRRCACDYCTETYVEAYLAAAEKFSQNTGKKIRVVRSSNRREHDKLHTDPDGLSLILQWAAEDAPRPVHTQAEQMPAGGQHHGRCLQRTIDICRMISPL